MGITLLVNGLGFVLIAAIVWWFWLGRSRQAAVKAEAGVVEILVANGTYTPGAIQARVNEPLTLRFIRKDESPCSATVVFDDFDLSAELPVDQPTDLSITPSKKGEFTFTCQMGMYRGRLVVE